MLSEKTFLDAFKAAINDSITTNKATGKILVKIKFKKLVDIRVLFIALDVKYTEHTLNPPNTCP